MHSSSSVLPLGTPLNFNAQFNSRPKSFIKSATTRIPGDNSVYLSLCTTGPRSPGLGSLSNSLGSFRGPRSAAGPAGRIRVTAEVSGDPKMSLVRELAGDIRADKEEDEAVDKDIATREGGRDAKRRETSVGDFTLGDWRRSLGLREATPRKWIRREFGQTGSNCSCLSPVSPTRVVLSARLARAPYLVRRLCFLLIYDTRPTRTAIVVAGLEGFRPRSGPCRIRRTVTGRASGQRRRAACASCVPGFSVAQPAPDAAA